MKKGSSKKRAAIAAIILLAAFLLDMAATKVVFDGVFDGYDLPAAYSEEDFDDILAADTEDFGVSIGKETLRTRLYKPQDTGDGSALVMLLPGMRAGFEDHLPLIAALLREGYCVFAIDPTGCRGSGGNSAVSFYRSVDDIDACLGFVEKAELWGCNALFLIGHSRGGYAVCRAVSSRHDITGVVSVSAPNSPMDAVLGSSSGFVGSALTYANLPALWLYQAIVCGPANVTASASSDVAASDVPVLVIHGAEDSVVPAFSRSLYSHRDDLEGGNAYFLLTSGDHTGVLYREDGTLQPEVFGNIIEFFELCFTGYQSE